MSGATRPIVIGYRCARHREVRQLNAQGTMRLTYFPQNGSTPAAECGACVAEEVEFIYAKYLDVLDLTADLLRSHCELRRKTENPLILKG